MCSVCEYEFSFPMFGPWLKYLLLVTKILIKQDGERCNLKKNVKIIKVWPITLRGYCSATKKEGT